MTIPPASTPVAFRLRRPYASEDEFIAGEGAAVSRTGMTLVGAAYRPSGVIVRFEIALWDGSPLFRGEGKVQGHRAAAEEGKLPGLDIRFSRLDARGKSLVDRILQGREAPRSAEVPELLAPVIPSLSIPPPAPSSIESPPPTSLPPASLLPVSLPPASLVETTDATELAPPVALVLPAQAAPSGVALVDEPAPDTERRSSPEPIAEPPALPEVTVPLGVPATPPGEPAGGEPARGEGAPGEGRAAPATSLAGAEVARLLGELRRRGGGVVPAPPGREALLGRLRTRGMH